MAVTNLLGTKWLLHRTINIPSSTFGVPSTPAQTISGTFSGFTVSYKATYVYYTKSYTKTLSRMGVNLWRGAPSSYSYSFELLNPHNSSDSIGSISLYSGTSTVSSYSYDKTFYDSEYGNIYLEFTSSNSNSTLIAWLEANAKNITEEEETVTDLSGTYWEVNSLTATASLGIFSVDGYYNNSRIVKICIGYEASGLQSKVPAANSVCVQFFDDEVYANISVSDALKITGGSDTENSTLISWLTTNASQNNPPAFSKTRLMEFENYISLEINGDTFNIKKYVEPVGPTLISFTIAGDTYQAEDGMTWAQWAASNYNADGFINDGSTIVNSSYTKAVATSSSGYNYVNSSDTITADFSYYLRNYGG